MCVHDSSCHFHKLADMSCEQHFFKSSGDRHINGVSDKITALYAPVKVVTICFFHVIQPVITGRNSNDPITFCLFLVQFHFDRIKKRLTAHRFYDPGSSQNGNSPDDSKPRIEGLLRQTFSVGHRDRDMKFSRKICQCAYLLHFFFDHFPWHMINGCISDLLI